MRLYEGSLKRKVRAFTCIMAEAGERLPLLIIPELMAGIVREWM